jgi:hypothetical protein
MDVMAAADLQVKKALNPADYNDVNICTTDYCNEPRAVAASPSAGKNSLTKNTVVLPPNNPLQSIAVTQNATNEISATQNATNGIRCYGNNAVGAPVLLDKLNEKSEYCVTAFLRCGGITAEKPSACKDPKATEDTVYVLYTHLDQSSLNVLKTAAKASPRDYFVKSCSKDYCNAPLPLKTPSA